MKTIPDKALPTPSNWGVKLQHPSWSLEADTCPRCSFPEAAAGYCEACGWSLPRPFPKEKK